MSNSQRAKFLGVFQMLEHFLADQEVALLLVAVANVALLDRVAVAVTEKPDQVFGEFQRVWADIEADAANFREIFKQDLGIHAAADADFEEQLGLFQPPQHVFAEPAEHVVVLRPKQMRKIHARQIAADHVIGVVIIGIHAFGVTRCLVSAVLFVKGLVPQGIVDELGIAVERVAEPALDPDVDGAVDGFDILDELPQPRRAEPRPRRLPDRRQNRVGLFDEFADVIVFLLIVPCRHRSSTLCTVFAVAICRSRSSVISNVRDMERIASLC